MPASIRTSHAQETKKVILETALRLFKEKSYSTVSVDEIVAAAGTSKGAFYYHFKSKDDLIVYEYAQSDEFYRDLYENELTKCDSAAEKILVFAQKQAENTMNTVDTAVYKIFLGSHLTNPKMDGVLTDPNRGFNSIIRQIVLDGQRRGEFRSDVPGEEITNAIVRGIRGLHFDWALQEYDLVRETTFFFKYMFLPGIVTPESGFHPVLEI